MGCHGQPAEISNPVAGPAFARTGRMVRRAACLKIAVAGWLGLSETARAQGSASPSAGDPAVQEPLEVAPEGQAPQAGSSPVLDAPVQPGPSEDDHQGFFLKLSTGSAFAAFRGADILGGTYAAQGVAAYAD